MFSWEQIKRPVLALAPMAGYTDSAFRQCVKELSPEVVCFTELTSVNGLIHGNDATLRQIFDPIMDETNKIAPSGRIERKASPRLGLITQIFGNEPELFAKSAKLLEAMGADAIDINMGCPAKKIVSNDCGSALLENPSLAFEIVRATVGNCGIPVSVKMRIGVKKYDEDFFLEFVRGIEKAGAKLITIHGRTAKQAYGGESDWAPIYAAKSILKIPVIGNGDIRSGEDAVRKLQNLDGVMVGRGALGNPWIFNEISAALNGEKFTPLSFKQKLPFIFKHIELACKIKGEKLGMLEMRKQLAFYIKGLPKSAVARTALVKVNSQQEAIEVLQRMPLP